jgi:hypothetical protein
MYTLHCDIYDNAECKDSRVYKRETLYVFLSIWRSIIENKLLRWSPGVSPFEFERRPFTFTLLYQLQYKQIKD